jgi:hypothetical protein
MIPPRRIKMNKKTPNIIEVCLLFFMLLCGCSNTNHLKANKKTPNIIEVRETFRRTPLSRMPPDELALLKSFYFY